ncbi:MAG: hypothetical protein IJC68_00575 [Firmicutes bacterium]|nr:hypothetical protein [Bacillota bacterium]
MSRMIYDQAFRFLVLFYAGLLVAALVQCLEEVRAMRRPGRAAAFLLEILQWATAGLVLAAASYSAGYGRWELYQAAACLLGFFLWKALFAENFHHTVTRVYVIIKNCKRNLWKRMSHEENLTEPQPGVLSQPEGHRSGRGAGRTKGKASRTGRS